MRTEQKSDQFLAVVDTYKGIIYKIANSYCSDTETRKDLVQEIIVQLWRAFDRYDNQYKQSTWIYRIALNVAISFYRKENRRKEISNPLTSSILSLADDGLAHETESNLGLLQQFISELKELDKALMLLYLDEKSHKEISEIIGISETNVATKIGRIKSLLKQKFSSR
ncbi:MAG: sigma-70 family RNA polymerase sigma factor [Prolixibacteraceae bacterium]|nr:sigma-70 family RNA polymerase sigma factor [Prolixibacteraceae bacterium]